MSLWAVVPVKSLHAGKSRLAYTLSPEARKALILQWLAHTIDVLRSVEEIARVLVVSADDAVRLAAITNGAHAVDDGPISELNAAIAHAAAHARSHGASSVLVLPSDVPQLNGTDLQRLLQAHFAGNTARAVTVCPDRHEQGTNALLLTPPDVIAPMFGESSLERHLSAGGAAGARTTEFHLPRLMLDIDTPDDLQLLQREQPMIGRRSVRRYQPAAVPMTVIERVLSAATWAPSAHNRQPWRFAVLRDAAAKQELADAMGARLREDRARDGDDPRVIEADASRSRARITEAPIVVAVCMSMQDMDRYTDDKRGNAERVMAIQSVAMAVQNMLLAAHNEGIGACWMCAPLFCPDAVQAALALPADWEPQALVTLGYPANDGKPATRKSLDAISTWR